MHLPEKLFRENVEKEYDIKSQACYRCGITCHNNISEKNADGSKGEFLAKFDYEPLNLLSTNIGIHDAGQAARLIQLGDNYGMDAISLGVPSLMPCRTTNGIRRQRFSTARPLVITKRFAN